MHAVSIDRSALLQTAIVSLLNTLALACLAAVLAYWSWRWLLPAEDPAVRAATTAAGDRAGRMFGSAGNENATVVAASGVRLLGVVAAADGFQAYALMQVEGQPIVAVPVGDELAPGLRLVEVHPHQVVLARGGVREHLLLPRPAPPLPTPVR